MLTLPVVFIFPNEAGLPHSSLHLPALLQRYVFCPLDTQLPCSLSSLPHCMDGGCIWDESLAKPLSQGRCKVVLTLLTTAVLAIVRTTARPEQKVKYTFGF